MKSHYRAVVIGGGIVGVSVLYHLAKHGWSDVALIERAELTAGSTWHAAAGCHAQNANPHVAALQGYTIRLYKEIERESGQDVGLKMTGGISLAASPERFEHLKMEHALFQTMDMETELLTPQEIARRCPIVDVAGLHGGLYDAHEGRLDPHGSTHAFAGAARKRGAEIVLRNRVLELHPCTEGWRVVTEMGTLTAEHVVNAAGLWARRVGRMAGVNLPVIPMQHHYLVTEDIPELVALAEDVPAVTDLEGFTYLQQERKGLLLGVYERDPRHWLIDGAPWDYGMDLLPPDLDRISAELEIGFRRFPVLARTGIRRIVHGAFAMTPDGNPLVGPVPGLRNYWAACGCMAGFSQGGAIGLALARWMIEGDPGADIFGMDGARYGPFASDDRYLRDVTAQFYARRFVITHPNEELPAGRPCKTTPCHVALTREGARWSVSYGMETPAYFARGEPDFAEPPSLRRTEADRFVLAEHRAVREAVGMFESAVYARYEVRGPGAEAYLDRLLAARLPAPGRVKLAPMLAAKGMLMGDLTVSRLAADRFWLIGSFYLQAWHMRWFTDHLPASGVTVENLSDRWLGFALSGPNARALLSRVTAADVSNAALPFLSCRDMRVAEADALVARLSLTGELGFEINVPAEHQLALYHALTEAGRDLGLRSIGNRALDTLRLEKSYGIWSFEYAASYTPAMAGLDRFIAFDKPDFIGRDAALRERDAGPAQRLVTLAVDAPEAVARSFAPVWCGNRRAGFITSGADGHHVKRCLALAYVDTAVAREAPPLAVDIIGVRREARIIADSPYDPAGLRLRT